MFWLLYFVFGPLLLLAAWICGDAKQWGVAGEASDPPETAADEHGLRLLYMVGLGVTFVGLLFSIGSPR